MLIFVFGSNRTQPLADRTAINPMGNKSCDPWVRNMTKQITPYAMLFRLPVWSLPAVYPIVCIHLHTNIVQIILITSNLLGFLPCLMWWRGLLCLAADYYNSSAESREISDYGLPLPFESRTLGNYPDGYPVVFEIGLGQAAAQRVLQFLQTGNFVDTLTATLKLRIVCFNKLLQVFG